MLSLDLDPKEGQPMKLMIQLIIITSVIEHVFCARQECSSTRALHRGEGEGVEGRQRSFEQGRLPRGGGA